MNAVFPAEFPKECTRDNLVSGRFKLFVQHFVRFWIDRSVQPILLIVESDHGFVDRNVIRASSSVRL